MYFVIGDHLFDKVYLYLQGVIRDEQDLDLLGPEFRQAYSQRQTDPFDETAWETR